MSETTFTARFEDCPHTRELPLLHSAGHVNCFVCQPELRDKPIKGKCPACDLLPWQRQLADVKPETKFYELPVDHGRKK